MIVRLALQAMATRFELVLGGGSKAGLRAAGEAALLEVEACDRQLSLYRSDSLLSHLNRVGLHRPVELDADTFELFEDCARVHADSDGAFDVTVAPLMRRLREERVDGGALDAARDDPAVGADALELDPERRTIRYLRAVEVDLGAVGKGHALDLAARVLRESGVECALLHGGTSTVVAVGAPTGQDAWRISVAGARSVELRDRALSVSAAEGRQNSLGEGHLLDPRTGTSVPAGPPAAVIAETARLADAWSTALFVSRSSPSVVLSPSGLAEFVA